MQQLMKQAQKMQEQMASAQEELAAAEVTGTAGGGLVTAVVSGTAELKSLTIDPSAIDPADPADTAETIADLVVAAVRDATRAAQDLAAEKMGPVTGGLGGLGLPGM
jgi:DNA-binding YbaB/EbfC family protein